MGILDDFNNSNQKKINLIELLEKARDNISREPDKCLIYIEKAIRKLKE